MQQWADGFIFSRWVTAGGGWSPGISHVPVGGLNRCLSPSRTTPAVSLDPLYQTDTATSTKDAMQAYLVADTAEEDRS